jgi:hypothetical protein
MAENYSFQDDRADSSTQMDMTFMVPAGKLDADEYSAEDLDGVTESLLGSGNLNFLSLQAGQTNDALSFNSAHGWESENILFGSSSVFPGFIPAFDNIALNNHLFEGNHSEISTSTDTDRSIDAGDPFHMDSVVMDGRFANATVGSLGASTLSSDAGSFVSASNLSLDGESPAIENGGDETTIVNQTIENVTNNVSDTIQNTINTVSDTIQNITNLGNEIIENILGGNITEVSNLITNEVLEVTNTVNDVLQDLGITEIINPGEIIDQVINNETLNEITDTVTSVVDDTLITVTNQLTDLLDNGGIALDLNGGVLESLGAQIGLNIDDTVSGALGTDLVSGNVTGLVQELTGIDIPLVTELGGGLDFNLLNGGEGTDNTAGDSDLSVAGLDLPDIALDPVESLVGDIDIHVNVPPELADPDALVEGVQDIVNGLGDLELADGGEILDLLGDQGADGDLGLDLFGNEIDHTFGADGNGILGQTGMEDILDLENPGDIVEAVPDIVSDPAEVIDNVLGVVDEAAGAGEITGQVGDILDSAAGNIPDVVEDLAGNLVPVPDLPVSEVAGDILDLVDEAPGSDNTGSLVEDLAETVQDAVDDVTGGIPDIAGNVLGSGTPEIEEALDLLTGGDVTGDGIDLAGDLGNIWTESGGGNGGLFDDIVGGGDSGESLPDPTGIIAEGLGVLDMPHDTHHGGLGGGLGGLFH